MDLIRERQGVAGSTQILDLSHAHLDTFPTEIEFLREVLEKLTMSHNSIRTLPLQLNMFTSLRYLNIRANSIRIFPAVLCHLSSLEILDTSRNKISRFPDSFGNLMSLRVLSISRNRIETIPLYVGDMAQLQFLKIELNPIVFPPPEIVEFSGQDMEGWLTRLKTFLVYHQKERERRPRGLTNEESRVPRQDAVSMPQPQPQPQPRASRSASESMTAATIHRQSRSEFGLRLSTSNGDRLGQHPAASSPEPVSHKLIRSSSHGEDHYRFISHSRGVSGDSNSSFGSNASNDCDKYSEAYFQRLAAYPTPSHPLPSERLQLVEAARGILFALSQIYRAVKQVVGCSTDEKFSLLFVRLLQSANSAMTQLIQSLDKFDSSAQVQVPDQALCAEIVRCCESNVAAFRKLVHMVQMQIRNISLVADARLVRNLVLMLHGALSEIRVAWDSLLPLLPGSGDSILELEPSQHVQKDQQQQQQVGNTAQPPQKQYHQSHPFQLSPTLPASATWQPAQIPLRSQNMSRTSNHSSQSASLNQHEEEEDMQFLLTVERAIEAARRLIQSLTETCMTRVEVPSMAGSPQQKPLQRARSVSASPPRSSGSSATSGAQTNDFTSGKGSSVDPQQSLTVSTSPLPLGEDTSACGTVVPSVSATASSNSEANSTSAGFIRSPLFSSTADTVPYSSGMCVSLPINLPSSATKASAMMSTSGAAPADNSATLSGAGGAVDQGEDNSAGSSWHERRLGSHSKGSSKASFDPALPSIPQDEARELSSQTVHTPASESATSSSTSTPQFQPIGMAPRSVSVSGLPSSTSQHGLASSSTSNFNSMSAAPSSLPSQGFVGPNSMHHHNHQQQYQQQQQPMTPGFYSSALSSFPFPSSGGTAHPSTSQLWHELRDCLLQMIEIVKRLDFDLTMIRTDDHPHNYHAHQSQQQLHHIYQHHQYYHPSQFAQHHGTHQQSHIPHPHQLQQQKSSATPHLNADSSGFGPDESNILRRRFGVGISDFVKSVVVISTLVRQLSSASSGMARSSGSGSGVGLGLGPGSGFTATATTASSMPVLSTSPSTARTGSISGYGPNGVDVSSISTPTTASSTAQIVAETPGTKRSMTSSSSSSNGSALTASPNKMTQAVPQSQSQQPSHLQQTRSTQQPEIFSRLVTTNVSNLTKVTKELTVRMHRTSFREYLLSATSSLQSSGLVSSSSAGGGVGYGPNVFSNASYGSYGYGPVGASILAMRKGSLI
ncbi:RAM signaling network component [Mortierella sp. GBA30]|nr:RAM signaling network component [Mortierella sp. GBA30]